MLKYFTTGTGLLFILLTVSGCAAPEYQYKEIGPGRPPLSRTDSIRMMNEKEFSRSGARFTELGVVTVEHQEADERYRIAREAAREKGANLVLIRPARSLQRGQLREQVDMQSPGGFQQISAAVMVTTQDFVLLYLQSGGERYAQGREERGDDDFLRRDRPDKENGFDREEDFKRENEGEFRDRTAARKKPERREKEGEDIGEKEDRGKKTEKKEALKKEEEKSPPKTRETEEKKAEKSPIDSHAVAAAMIRSNFTDNENATFTGVRTGLMWSQCSMGQNPRFSECRGRAQMVPFNEAVKYCQSMDHAGQRWRLPRKRELEEVYRILMEINASAGKKKGELSDVIQEKFFPGVEVDVYWTDSVYRENKNVRWVVDFSGGDVFPYDANNKGLVRCVSDGPRK